MAPTLHYIHDPLCGWCYGAALLIREARDIVRIVPQGGGMISGNHQRRGAEGFRERIVPIAERIEAMTDQQFGSAYLDTLLRNRDVVVNSAIPIAAMLAVDALARSESADFDSLDMLADMQDAEFIEGRSLGDVAVLAEIAVKHEFPRDAFIQAHEHALASALGEHIQASRNLLRRVGADGFPTLAWETQSGFDLLDIGPWLNNLDAWPEWLRYHSTAMVHGPSAILH